MAKLFAFAATLGVVASLPKGPIGPPCFANEVAGNLYKDVDLTGKIAVVTGSDTGIGIEIARALAMRHATVILAGRNKAKMDAASVNITSTVPGAKCVVPDAPLDLGSFALTRAFAEGLQQYPAIDILINNAGMASTSKPSMSKDGFELVFEIDYMNTWLLTELLLPQVRAAKGRIVQVVSKAAALACEMSERMSCMDLKNLPPPPTSGTVPIIGLPRSNYGIAKLATIRSTEDLARREAAAGTGVTTYSTHPGYVYTGIPASPIWSKLACMSDGREGAPCPTTPPMGALTPVFLALAPTANLTSGSFYEWCYKSTLPDPFAPGKTQEYQEGLRKLTEKWLANYTKPLSSSAGPPALAKDSLEVGGFPCPSWLGPICKVWTCATGCLPQIKDCIFDSVCKAALIHATECSAKYKAEGKSANAALACFAPINDLRDKVFFCLLDEHHCIHPDKDNTTYPTCKDDSFKGDASYKPTHLIGDWWKNFGWTKGEMYECRPCGRVTFSPFRVLPWPTAQPEDTTDYAIIASNWYELDDKNKTWNVNETSYFGPRPGHKGFPEKQNHRGVQYGLSYLENFTMVHDGTQETEPFLFLYGCGSTIQGRYITGFVMSKNKYPSATLKKRIFDVAKQNGFDDEDEWCTVDNSCPPLNDEQFII